MPILVEGLCRVVQGCAGLAYIVILTMHTPLVRALSFFDTLYDVTLLNRIYYILLHIFRVQGCAGYAGLRKKNSKVER